MDATTTRKEHSMDLKWTIAPALPLEVELAEDAYSAYARQADAAPHLWGEDEEAELGRLAAALEALYDKHGTPADSRVQL